MNPLVSKKVVLPVAAVALVAAAVTALGLWRTEKAPEQIDTVGLVEATEVNLSSRITERILRLPYREGDRVPAGSVAIELDGAKIRAEVDKAEADVARAKADILEADARLLRARALSREAKRSLDRIAELSREGLASEADLDRLTTQWELADAELKEAEAKKIAAEADLRQRHASLALAEVRLSDIMISSPITGVVTLKAYEVGEMVAEGITILTLVDLTDRWVRVDLEETWIGRVRLGSAAEIHLEDPAVGAIAGKVVEIGQVGEFATQRDVTRGRQDIKTFRVKIRVDDPEGWLKPGMSVRARIQPSVALREEAF